jgi:hypothetical protein
MKSKKEEVVFMKIRVLKYFVVTVMLVSVCSVASAQQATTKTPPLKIKKFTALTGKSLVESPSYGLRDEAGIAKTGKAPEWRRINVEYQTAPEWIDELKIDFILVTLKVEREDGKNVQKYSVYKKSVTYTDVEFGRKHFASAFLHPNAEKRYGDTVAVAVVLSADGVVVEEYGEVAASVKKIFGANWWKNPKIMESNVLIPRSGYLLNKKESPFVFMNIDSYEVIK